MHETQNLEHSGATKEIGRLTKRERIQIVLDHKNIGFTPKSRLPALIEIIRSTDNKPLPNNDPLLSDRLINFMPGMPGMTQLDLWLEIREKEIDSLVHQDPHDAKKDLFYLMQDTEKYNESVYIHDCNRLATELLFNPYVMKAEIALRLMYVEAEELRSQITNGTEPTNVTANMAINVGKIGLHNTHN